MQDIFANTPSDDIKKKWAILQMQQGSDVSPVRHWTQALARALQGGMGGYMAGQAEAEDKAAGLKFADAMLGPAVAPAASGSPSVVTAVTPVSDASPQGEPKNWAKAISGIESGGKYDLLGPVTKTGDRAYGKYQVMGSNVGPWTKQYLGQELTPEQFIANPQAQDAVFQGRFGEYAKKYGPEGAARAWFAGEGGMNDLNRKDQLGTSVGKYAALFNKGMGQPAGVQVAAAPTGTASDAPAPGIVSGLPPQQMAQAAPIGQRTPGQVPPEVVERLRPLLADPKTRPYAAKQLEQYQKPTEQITPMNDAERRQWNVPEGVSAGIDRVTGKPVFSQPANSVNVNTAANPVLEGIGKQLLKQRESAQTAATVTIPSIHEARKALDEGAFTGAFATGRLNLAKVGQLFGISDPSAITSTETLRSAIGTAVLAHAKELGPNPSDADRRYIEAVMGGKIELDKTSIKRILDIQEDVARRAIKTFNRDAEKLMSAPGGSQAYQSVAPLMRFDEPAQYKSALPAAAPAAAPAQAAPTNGNEAAKIINGKTYFKKNGKWFEQ